MSIDTTQLATQMLLMAIGGITSGVIWVGTRLFKMKRDVDIAFQKIRSLENAGISRKVTCGACGKADE